MSSHLSLLVTGSRHLKDPNPVNEALDYLLSCHSFDSCHLYVGDCNVGKEEPREGADRFAVEWWRRRFGPDDVVKIGAEPGKMMFGANREEVAGQAWWSAQLHLHVADWYPVELGGKTMDRGAGPKRNKRLVDDFAQASGPHFPFAFWDGRVQGSGTLSAMGFLWEAKLDFTVVPV